MNDLDETTFERFAKRFARIERLVPSPPSAGAAALDAVRIGRRRPSRAVLASVTLLLSTALVLTVIGSQTVPQPSPTAAVASMPPDSAPPAAVLEAYLVALEANDCAIANRLTMPLVLNSEFVDLCAVTRVTAFVIEGEPAVVDFESVRIRARITITGTTSGLSAGEITGTYFLQRQASGAWRIIQGYLGIPSPTPTPRPTATRPARGELQHAHPQLGGTAFAITELEGSSLDGAIRLSFSGGPTGGFASGNVTSNCSFIPFDYVFDPVGPAIAFFVYGDDEGSYADGCSQAALAQYIAIAAVLPRVTDWRKPQADQIELLDGDGEILVKGGPVPPLPTPQASGDCGEIPIDPCQRAVAVAFNFGLFPASAQTVIAWRVQVTSSTICDGAIDPKYDVIFEMANPTDEWSVTVGEMFGVLRACGPY